MGQENPIIGVDKRGPLSLIGVKVLRITTGKLLMALMKN